MESGLVRILTIILIGIIGFLCGFFVVNNIIHIDKNTQVAEVVNSANKEALDEPKTKTSLFFVGDMMLDRGVESSVKKNFSDDFSKLFENISALKNANILFGNLEGPVTDKGANAGSKYSFEMNPKIAEAIKNAGFDIVSFANNHVGDRSLEGFKKTLNNLKNNEILYTGAGTNKTEAENPTIIEKNNIKFGFLGFSDVGPNWIKVKDNTPGINIADPATLPKIVEDAKKQVDILVVSFHFGEEYKTVHNTRQELLAHLAIDSGADIIVGHHPHVMEDIETYKNKPIVYSLGNFIFDQSFSKDTMRGMLFEVNFEDKNIKSWQKKIITLNKKFQPEGIYNEDQVKDMNN